MKIKIESKIELETIAYLHQGELKTHPCELGAWWGNDTCDKVNFIEEISKVNLPEGEYKITIVLEKIDDL